MSQNQKGFKPVETCMNQLLTVTHKSYKCVDAFRN